MAAIVFVGGPGSARSTDEEGQVSGDHAFLYRGWIPLSYFYLFASL